MSKFDYPRLSATEIVTILTETEIAVITENDLKNPNPDFVSDLYTRLLIFLDVLHEDDQGQLDFAALEQLENPDLHVRSVQIMKLYSMVKEVVTTVNCPMNFTLKDLIRPDATRTEYFLSAILNFCLYKDTKMNLLRPIAEDLTRLDEQRSELEDKISQLNAEIAAYNEVRERELPLVQEVDAKVKELRQTIQDLNKHQVSLRTTLNKLKEKTGALDEKFSQTEFDLVQSVQQNADLRSKIVQSPEKLQTLKKMSKQSAQMQAILEQVNSAKSIEKDYKSLKARLNDDVVLDKSLEAKLIERQGKVEQLDELQQQLEKERNLKSEDATRAFENVKLEMESKRQDLEARQKKVEAVVTEVDAITSKTKFVKESGAAKLQELASKAEEIVEKVTVSSETIPMCSRVFAVSAIYKLHWDSAASD
ncbi:kinetochore protein NUF2-like [Citrus sinensis]|uniref:Kinetochore protein NUF2-like n=1 Tax=Citrus sinensis TaxID=2711 RepID=A0ACB8MW30_CITSI|nr:kinetochore protein NUF2-like [Citrus sinensis]